MNIILGVSSMPRALACTYFPTCCGNGREGRRWACCWLLSSRGRWVTEHREQCCVCCVTSCSCTLHSPARPQPALRSGSGVPWDEVPETLKTRAVSLGMFWCVTAHSGDVHQVNVLCFPTGRLCLVSVIPSLHPFLKFKHTADPFSRGCLEPVRRHLHTSFLPSALLVVDLTVVICINTRVCILSKVHPKNTYFSKQSISIKIPSWKQSITFTAKN